jgi:histone-lysine N-methyltransferase SETMAR
MWLPEGTMPQSHPMTIISTPKVMVSIFWSSVGFAMIIALSPRTKFTSAYFCDDIILMIVERMPFDLVTSPQQLMLHMDHTTPNRARELIKCMRKLRIHPIGHPPHSPDLATYNFYLFGKLKAALVGHEFDSTKQFLLGPWRSPARLDELSLNQSLMPVNAD